jgi:DNA-directed RNA polymerase specialized sigma24 family protein
LAAVVRRQFPGGGSELAHDIATDAILHYLADPSRCDSAKGTLWGFLCGIAARDAIDAARQATGRMKKQRDVEFHVELWGSQTNETEQVEFGIDARKIMEMHRDKLIHQPADGRLLDLILQQESRTSRFADALGLDPMAPDVEKTVKQAKDKMLLRLKRLRDEL